MSGSERVIADDSGRFLHIVDDGRRVDDPEWSDGRMLLSNRRLLLVDEDGKRTIRLSAIDSVRGFDDGEPVAGVDDYATIRWDDDIILLSPEEHRAFERALCAALVDDGQVLVDQPAGSDGADWASGRVSVADRETLEIETDDGSIDPVPLDDVRAVRVDERTVPEEPGTVVEVEHSMEGDDVETHIAGSAGYCSFLSVLLSPGSGTAGGRIETDAAGETGELDDDATRVLTALYSGVSSFEVPEFTGLDVEETEAAYERLIDLGVLSEVRTRREVELTARGQNLASAAINDE